MQAKEENKSALEVVEKGADEQQQQQRRVSELLGQRSVPALILRGNNLKSVKETLIRMRIKAHSRPPTLSRHYWQERLWPALRVRLLYCFP